HPACTVAQARGWLLSVGGAGPCWILKSATEGLAADRKLAAEGWDLAQIARRYRRFRDSFAPVAAAVRESDALPTQAAFLVRTLLVKENRKINLQDPRLPPALVPTEWVGTEAYELTARLYAAVFATAERFLTESGRTITGPLPPAGAEIHARFGGRHAGRPD
ncbi:MAG: PaaX family transcriptional regulator C-terminal domain-containing protein, partial [Steroidobacteraceae bacterium]